MNNPNSLTPEDKQKLSDESFARDFMQSRSLETEAIARRSFSVQGQTSEIEKEIEYIEEGIYDDSYREQYGNEEE